MWLFISEKLTTIWLVCKCSIKHLFSRHAQFIADSLHLMLRVAFCEKVMPQRGSQMMGEHGGFSFYSFLFPFSVATSEFLLFVALRFKVHFLLFSCLDCWDLGFFSVKIYPTIGTTNFSGDLILRNVIYLSEGNLCFCLQGCFPDRFWQDHCFAFKDKNR